MKKQFQKGLTVAELIITIGIFLMVTTSLFIFISNIVQDQKRLAEYTEQTTDLLLGERFIERDLRYSAVSFLGVQIGDDLNRNFFDFIPDVPDRFLSDRERRITLQSGGRQEMFFLVENSKVGSPFVFDPVLAYQVGARPSLTQSAPITFVSLNQNSLLTRERPQMWQDGQMVLLDSFAMTRRPNVAGEVNMNDIPKPMAFLGLVQGNQLSRVASLNAVFSMVHPMTSMPINTVDDYLRGLLPVGGGAPFIRIRGVQMIRYYIEPDPQEEGKSKVFRSTFQDGDFSNPQLVSDRVRSLVFERSTLTSAVISFRLIKD